MSDYLVRCMENDLFFYCTNYQQRKETLCGNSKIFDVNMLNFVKLQISIRGLNISRRQC